MIKFDLYETFKEKQSFMDRLGDKVADWGLDSLWEKHMNPDDRFSFNKLHQMSGVAKEWIKRNNEYNRSKTTILDAHCFSYLSVTVVCACYLYSGLLHFLGS